MRYRHFSVASLSLHQRSLAPMPKEAKWMRQLCAGEPVVWAQLIDHWSPCLYGYITANGASEADAQQLVCTIFSEVVQAVVGSLRIANLTVLIFSIAYQQMLNYCQQRLSPLQSHRLSAADHVDPQFVFLHTLHQFAPEVQQLLLLHYLCEVSLSDISQIVGQSEEVLKKILYRVQHHLC
jgi:DNA-directed RNA polymerase specialized sigma24 family protein